MWLAVAVRHRECCATTTLSVLYSLFRERNTISDNQLSDDAAYWPVVCFVLPKGGRASVSY
jgi:hypothetical protein